MNRLLGARIRALREQQDLSQEDVARIFGFKDRQTVSAIETGERRLSAAELLIAVDKLGAPLDYFTDPFLLVGEGRFSWRQSGVAPQRLRAFERAAGRWIAAHRALAPQVDRPPPNMRWSLKLTAKSRFEDAMAAGERFAADFRLGTVPAANLVDVMERDLGILVLMVDAIEGISGAACRLPELDTVLINRHEVPGRRHFDLAHELFHVLTWDAMPPEHVEEPGETSRVRVERLANNFAAALLMPAAVLEAYGPWTRDLARRLNAAAEALQVTATAMKWRLVALGWLTPATANDIPDAGLRNNGRPSRPAKTASKGGRAQGPARGAAEALPPLFSRPFVEVLALAIAGGQLTVPRAADLVEMPVEDLAALCQTHRVEVPFDL